MEVREQNIRRPGGTEGTEGTEGTTGTGDMEDRTQGIERETIQNQDVGLCGNICR